MAEKKTISKHTLKELHEKGEIEYYKYNIEMGIVEIKYNGKKTEIYELSEDEQGFRGLCNFWPRGGAGSK
jgi:hypothetical protein